MPAVQANLHHCKRVGRWVRSALLHTTLQTLRQANHHRSQAPAYLLGQKVLLSSYDLPLQVDSQKLAPLFGGPIMIDCIVNQFASSCLLRSRFIPLSTSLGLSWTLSQIWSGALFMSITVDVVSSSWSIGRAIAPRSWIPRWYLLDDSLLPDFYWDHSGLVGC